MGSGVSTASGAVVLNGNMLNEIDGRNASRKDSYHCSVHTGIDHIKITRRASLLLMDAARRGFQFCPQLQFSRLLIYGDGASKVFWRVFWVSSGIKCRIPVLMQPCDRGSEDGALSWIIAAHSKRWYVSEQQAKEQLEIWKL